MRRISRTDRRDGGHDTIIHLASNPDIAKAQVTPDVDFYEGTLLTTRWSRPCG